ncbi:MAG: hypothetical protein ACOYXC_11715 [Candidatus Rifleibacteriota bacterium]
MKRLFVVLTVLLVMTTFSKAMAEVEIMRDPNAALRYLMIMGFMPDLTKEDEDALRDIDSLESYEKMSDRTKGKLSEATSQRTRMLLKYAADCPDCNFMPDQNFKPEDYVPPYRTLRRFSRYLNAGAWSLVKKGDHKGAAELLVSVFRFGDHVENYGPLISVMIGHAIREYALASMKNFLAADYPAEAKSIITDYIKSLPKPAFNMREGLIWERKFMENLLKTLTTPEGVIEIMKVATDNVAPVKTSISSCNANQRVLMGAMEMALMDGIKFDGMDFDAIQKKLVNDKYLLKPLECADKGTYKVDFKSADDWKVSCSCGADPDAPPKEEPKPAKEEDPDLLAKAKEYQESGKFDKDKKEFYEYFDKILALDIFDKELIQKAKVLQEDYESRDNLLIKTSAPNFGMYFEKQVNMQNEIEKLIK